jgi:hypothetical protein
MTDENQERPKIIVDEDWKTQVEAEREQARTKQDGTQPAEAPSGPEQLPPASMTFLISTISAQIMAALGQFPDPVVGKPVLRLDYAKLQIDTLEVLREKTKGNLSAEESALLEDSLHQLRMLFLAIKTEVGSVKPDAGESPIVS